jgi:hypothetical protein
VDPKSRALLEILKSEQAMACPTTQDQINHRRNAEKILGPDENLFRIDWVSLNIFAIYHPLILFTTSYRFQEPSPSSLFGKMIQVSMILGL